MRIIDYYNYIATAACILMGAAAVIIYLKGDETLANPMSARAGRISFVLVMVIAAVLRLYNLGQVPLGLQQDEASIGYDAYCLATYGIDRNGFPWPVYPITWGCGGGSPLLIYLNALSISLFGTGVFKLRLIPAILGIATVALFYLVLKLGFKDHEFKYELSLLGAGFLAICPWHVILSRWSLDSNIMPFSMMLPLYLILLAADKKSTGLYCLSAAFWGLSMYSYGAATIVVPVFLVLMCGYLIRTGDLKVSQLLLSGLSFMVVFAPLLVFYGVNYLGFDEILTPVFSVNRFTSARTGEAFIALDSSFSAKALHNLRMLLKAVSVGDSGFTLAHYYPGYGTLFTFTFPITLIGFVISIRSLFGKRDIANAAFVFMTIASVILGVLILPDIQRFVTLFIPCIYFMVRGGAFLVERCKVLLVAFACLCIIGGISFARDYFTDYNRWATSIFMPGYGDAVKRAYEIAGDDRQICSTYEGLSAPFMSALYFNDYDPGLFYTTVVYKDDTAEFRIARSFGNFVFELPEDMLSDENAQTVYILASSEVEKVEQTGLYTVEDFGGYRVAYR
jgi:hypothetical protein